jgi:CO/xanthine dehydrogenase FAD-binding subunit
MNVSRYVRPANLGEALAVLETYAGDALVIAGGTDLVPMLRRTSYANAGDGGAGSDERPRILVDVGLLREIAEASEADGVIHVGGGMTMAAIAASTLLNEKTPVLVASAKTVGSPLVRNRATVAGNLATASPSADTAPALLALDAGVRLASAGGGVREIPLTEFFVSYRSTLLRETELITDILIPVPSAGTAGRFEKVGLRNADAISVVCVATVLELDGTRCLKARIALGAVAPVPVRALAVEQALEGRDVDAQVARECARLVHEHITPIDDVRGSGEYRRWVAEAVVARAIMQTVGTEDAD